MSVVHSEEPLRSTTSSRQPACDLNDELVWDNQWCAKLLNAQYMPCPTTTTRTKWQIVHRFHHLNPEEVEVTPDEVQLVLKRTKASKALGPDHLTPIHLQHLGISGLHYLMTVINLSINSTKIPTRWKEGRIILLLKPGKPADQGKSYCLIALLSPVAKLAEKLLLLCLQEHHPLANHQHGFHSGHSTTTALNCVTHKISTGLNRPKPCERTMLIALNLTSAFNTVSHEVLLGDIYNTNAPNYIKKWLAAYINGRSTYVEFRWKISKKRKVRQGVLQGGVLSPALFNTYMSSLPAPQDNVTLVSYVDDITIMSSAVQPEQACTAINNYLIQLATWLEQCSLILSMGKSSVTLFTTWTKLW